MPQTNYLRFAVALCCMPGFVHAFVNGTFDDPTIVGSAGQIFPVALDVGGDGANLDDGWLDGQSGTWEITDGQLVRTDNTRFSQRGIGQAFSNPGFASGEEVILSFDYNYTSDTPLDFGLWGIPDSLPLNLNNWAAFAGDSVTIANAEVNLSNGDIGNYDLVELSLQTLGGDSTNVAGTYEESVTLSDDFDIFIFVIAAELNNTANRVAEFDNFSLGVIPEPSHAALLGSLVVAAVCVFRSRRRES